MWPSVRSGYRFLANRPGIFAAAVLTLTLCIGANSAMFSPIDAVLLRPLPYADGARLMVLFETNPARKTGLVGVAPARVEDWNLRGMVSQPGNFDFRGVEWRCRTRCAEARRLPSSPF